MAKLYRSVRGKIVDIEKLRQANEGVTAVTGGSQHVNSRGDELGPGGRIIRTREEVIKSYNKNNPNAVEESPSELIPDAPQKVPTPDAGLLRRTTMDNSIPAIPIDEIYKNDITEEDKQNLLKTEEQRYDEMNQRTREMREKRQEQRLADQKEQLREEEISDLIGPDPEKEKLKTVVKSTKSAVNFVDSKVKIDSNVLNKLVIPTATPVKNVWVDHETRKEYKTEAALKSAITKRERKSNVKIKKPKDDDTDKGFNWVE